MKKVVIILIGVFAVFIAALACLWWLGGQSVAGELAGSGIKKINRPDSDNDGLADWEEVEWHTNPTNPDTDGDGTSDGAEVAAGRNPLVRGPNDKLTNPQARLEALVRNAILETNKPLISPSGEIASLGVYQRKDLQLESAETAASVAEYGRNLRSALQTFTAAKPGGESAALVAYVAHGDENALAPIVPAAQTYFALVQSLLAMDVPASAATLHLELINRASYLAQLAYLMSQVKTEPLIATRAAQASPGKLLEFTDFLRQFDPYFAARNIR